MICFHKCKSTGKWQ